MGRIWDLDQFRDNKALIDDHGGSVTYGQLMDDADKLAEVIGKRCLVFSLCSNEIGSVLGYVGFVNNGIVTAQLSGQLDRSFLSNLIGIYKPSYMWVPETQKERFEGMEKLYSICWVN